MQENKVKKFSLKKVIALALTGVFVAFLLIVSLSYFLGYEVHSNVSYGDTESNVMDIYIPKKAYERKTNGCVVFIHGGSWTGGDKSEETARCRLLASKGYITASINYSLHGEQTANEYTVFKVLNEIDLALLKIKSFTQERGITVDKVATSGYSAGAHLSMLYAFSRGENTPIKVVFTANMAGPADFSADIWGEEKTKIIINRLTGETVNDVSVANDLISQISPTTYINGSTPPTIIMHGEKDDVVPIKNALSVVEKLESNSVPYDYIPLANSNHSLIQNPFKHITYYKTLLNYCEKYF